MTHYTVALLVPPSQLARVASFIDRQMAPYYEQLDVPPYVCYSLKQAEAELAASVHRLELIIERREPHFDLDRCRDQLFDHRRTTPQQFYADRLEHFESFNDRGEPISTCNPQGKWDWYVVGGRWDGWINDRQTDRQAIADNMATVEQALARDKITHAIVSPDGQWHERGRMGWWANLLAENENWPQDARQILARYSGHEVVLIDAHV